MYTLIATAKLNNIDPQAWLADVLRRIADHPARRLHEPLPWNWHAPTAEHVAAPRNLSHHCYCRLLALLQIMRRRSAASAGCLPLGRRAVPFKH
jgi:hypothetical protein